MSNRKLNHLFSSRTRTHAFSLVEILVVVAIIGLLAMLAISGFGAAQESMKQIKCASNLRQILLALYSYAQDNDNTFPPVSEANSGTKRWTRDDRLGLYLPERTNPHGWENPVFVCPAATCNGQSGLNLRKTYAATQAMFGNLGTYNKLGRPVMSIAKPSLTPIVVELIVTDLTVGSSCMWEVAYADIQIQNPQLMSTLNFVHNKKMNLGMVDGSVRLMSPADCSRELSQNRWMGIDDN